MDKILLFTVNEKLFQASIPSTDPFWSLTRIQRRAVLNNITRWNRITSRRYRAQGVGASVIELERDPALNITVPSNWKVLFKSWFPDIPDDMIA